MSPRVVVRELPDEQPEQREHDPDRADLGAPRLHQTMNTVVPIVDVVEQPLGLRDLNMRMQPCERL